MNQLSKQKKEARKYNIQRAGELFDTLSDNRTSVIAEMMGCSYHVTSKYLDEYLKGKAIITEVIYESKMNKQDGE